MRTLYTNIKAFIKQQLPQVVHVNIWNNQLANLQDEPQFLRPAVFVEFGIVEWTKTNKSNKTGTIPVTLHIVNDCYDTDADDIDMMNSLELLNEVEEVFDGATLQACTPFINTSTQPDHDHGNLIENITTYTTEYTKCIRSNRKMTEVNAGLQVEGTIKKPL